MSLSMTAGFVMQAASDPTTLALAATCPFIRHVLVRPLLSVLCEPLDLTTMALYP